MTPSVVTGPYASNIVSIFDIDKPERFNRLMRKRGDQGLGYMALLKSLGYIEPTAQDLYTHTEDDWKHQTFTEQIGSVSGVVGSNNQIILTLSASDIYTDPQGGIHFYPRVGDAVMFPNEDTGIITAINLVGPNWELTVLLNNFTANVTTSAGDEIIINSGAFSEGSDQPLGVVDAVYNYSNRVQKIKETLTATGTEMTSQKWFDMYEDGTGAKFYYLIGQENTEYRLMLKQDGALLFQQPTTAANPIIDTTTNRPIFTTEGLFPATRRIGNTQVYTPGSLVVTDYDTMARTFDREFAGRIIGGLHGIGLEQEVENVLAAYLQNTNVIFATREMQESVFGGDEGLAVSVAFNTLIKGGRIYNFRKMGIFSHAKLYGAGSGLSAYNGPSYGMYVPFGKKKDKKAMTDIPSFGMRFKKFGEYSRMMEVWNVSGAGTGPKVISADLHNYYMRTDIGAEHIAVNQFVLLTP